MNVSAHQSVKETNMTSSKVAKRGFDSKRHVFRGFARILAVFVVAVVTLLGGQVAAQAHDSLDSTLPANGSSVEAMPAKITITMSNTPAALGAQIQIIDGTGADWSQGEVSVLDNAATIKTKGGAPAGNYTVKWRLVSSDSHPVEGQFTFVAKTAAAGSAGGAVAGPVTSLNAVSEQATPNAPETDGVPWSVYGLIGILVIVVVAMIVITRRRLSAEDAKEPTP